MQTLVQLKKVKKSFKQNDRQDLLVLDDVNIHLYPGEIVALLGRTGAGKSTLLRIISGLTPPTSGEVYFSEKAVQGPMQGMSMVFQDFALLPWLSVLQNVELGLEAQGIPADERRERALKAIDIVGMDGFESAFPKELSGGMCQRVGFARALVVDPDLLLMDEPFSALDVLTSEGLRSDLLDIWLSKKTKIKSILLVTHNIEEAVSLADRVLIFGTNPGTVRQEIKVDIPHPRDEHEEAVHAMMDKIYTAIADSSDHTKRAGAAFRTIDLYYRLPKASVSEMTGLMEVLSSSEFEDQVELSEIAEAMHLDVDELFPLTEALEILRFAEVKDGEVNLTASGRMFTNASILDKKKIFAAQLMGHVPLARHIRRVLDERPSHTATQDRFLQELEDHLSEEASDQVFKTVIDWSRYAELFAFDFNTKLLSLENPS